MKIKLSKAQWEKIGKTAGWMKLAGEMTLEQAIAHSLNTLQTQGGQAALVDFQKFAPAETTKHPMFGMLWRDAFAKKDDPQAVKEFITGFN